MKRRWLLRGLLLFVLAFANLNHIWSPDVIPNALFAWTLLREGDADMDEFVAAGPPQSADLIDRDTYFFRACGESTATEPPRLSRSVGGPPHPGPSDRVCSVFPPGMAVLALPLHVPLVLAGVPPTDLSVIVLAGHAVAAVIETIAILLLWSVFARFAPGYWPLALVLLYALGTSVRTVASQALWQHAGVHLAVAFALWLTLREAPPSPRRELVAGLALGLGAVVRQTTVVIALGLAAPRRLLVMAGVALGLLPLFLYNGVVFGDPLEQGYGGKPFELASAAAGLYGLLLSPSRGLFIYEPYVLAAVAALILAWRRPGYVAGRLRGLSLAAVATLVLYATYAEWWGGRVFGPRFLDDLAPVFFAALAWGVGQGLLSRRAARALFLVAAAWSLLIFQAAAFAYDAQRWDTIPINVNFQPERLFDWSDPQWLAVLRDAGAGGARVALAAVLTLVVVATLVRSERVLRSRGE